MKNYRKAILITGVVLVALTLGFFGLRGFVRKIYTSTDCDWANIDHIEMRAGVNIPYTKNYDCHYDAAAKTRTVRFEFDTTRFDIDVYLEKNRFAKIDRIPANLAMAFPEKHDTASLYWREGDRQDTAYQMLYDKKTSQLYVYLKYKT